MIQRPEWAYYDAPSSERSGEGDLVLNANRALVRSLLDGAGVSFRGQTYDIPPVPFPLGLKLDALRRDWDIAVQNDDARMLARLFKRGVRMIKKAMKPRSVFKRALWWIEPNPFKHASNGEFVDLLGFLLVCRMKSTILGPATGGRPERLSMRQTSTRNSVSLSPAGRAMASRSRGGTI